MFYFFTKYNRQREAACRRGAGVPDSATVVRTGTRVDTGGWGLNPRLRAAVVAGEVVLFAPGKRPFVEKLPVTALGASAYNHVTGELVLASADGKRRLKLPPVEGRMLLAAIQGKED
jgi:hypothetical protein